ncbi:GGDEF domain-containing protein [Marinobacterium sp. AK62]|uniref:diguanylate cyclase n=1 Tax=Marinobacterium alkalitolerans TaxID=1542925 RepID=A0ABS3Z9B4_9GAMM|nr:diguanylate cyclase [Marinobacterium alkalitolerans]MBP0048295.1 GGDEF domain-containing protein [Marinobacterium alkalitolerans]
MSAVQESIGTRLTLIIGLVFSLYLASASVIGYVMYQQYQAFRELAGEHFDRALKAAELTRSAEVIAAEVFEVLVSGERSLNAGSNRTENLMQLYQATRRHLEENDLMPMQGELDEWQEPFFSSLKQLDANLADEHDLQSRHFKQIDKLFLLLRDWPSASDWVELPEQQQQYYIYALQAIGFTGTALNSERPGQIAQLEARMDAALAQLEQVSLEDRGLDAQQRLLASLLMNLLEGHRERLKHKRATLSQARKTRVLAQKLTGASYSYHLELKQAAQEAIASHKAHIRRTLSWLGVAAVLLIAVTTSAVLYIRRTVVKRINRLSAVMQAHLDGAQVPIPSDGRDEIALMGSTFAYFVEARRQAEQNLAEANAHLQDMNLELERASTTDALTGIANRRCFERAFEAEWRRAQREQQPLAVVMGDVDLFKSFNDYYGHQAGDDCLHRVAQTMARSLHRSGDLVARYGGEEFVLLLPGLNTEQAEQMAWKLLEAVREQNIPHHASLVNKVTLSLGVASVVPDHSSDPDGLIGLADNALYAAKSAGRNNVQSAPSSEPK